MADKAIPWFESFQKIGRGFRPGMEVQVVSAGKNVGKSVVILDYESEDFEPWKDTLRERFATHYAEYMNYDTGETFWKKFPRRPGLTNMHLANHVIKQNDDGTFSYIKNRTNGELCQVPEKELMWIILKAG